MKKSIYKLSVFNLLLIIITSCTSVPQKPAHISKGDYRYTQQYLSWMIHEDMHKHNVKGLSIALIDDQTLVWADGFGYADVEKKLPATLETVYRIGSISKVFTAIEIIKLWGEGRIQLDSPLNEYIPDFSINSRFPNASPITLRSLLAHHSGLPSNYIKGMRVSQPDTLSELVDKLKNESLVSPPQTTYKYSNLDYSLLGRVIENIRGGDFSSIMQQDLLKPLGMERSSFLMTPDIDKFLSKGYRNGKSIPLTDLRDKPAGSMLSNVVDVSRLMKFIFAGGKTDEQRLIYSERLNEMFQPQFGGHPLDFGTEVGLGWMLNGLDVPGADKIAWHDGEYPPFFASILILPSQKLGVIILANSDEAKSFVNQVAVKAMELALEAKYGIKSHPVEINNKLKPVALTLPMLKQYEGNYVVFGEMIPVISKGSDLLINIQGKKYELSPINSNTFVPNKSFLGLFSIPLSPFKLQFLTIEGRSLALLTGLPAPVPFEKIPKYIVPNAWKKRLGEYRCNSSDEQFDFKKVELKILNGIMVIHVRLSSRITQQKDTGLTIALNPISSEEALVVGLGQDEGGIVRVIRENYKEKLWYSGFLCSPVVTEGHG